MKKRWLRRASAAGLSLTLAAGLLTGCGRSGADKEKNALAKECVYRYQEFDIPTLGGDYTNLLNSFEADGRVYVLMQVEHYAEEYFSSYHLISFQEDGTDVRNVELETNKTVLTEEELNSSGADSEEGSEDGTVDGGIDILPMPLSASWPPAVNAGTDVGTDADTDVDEDTDIDSAMGTDDDPIADDDEFGEDEAFGDDDEFAEDGAFGDDDEFGEDEAFGDDDEFAEDEAFGDDDIFTEDDFYVDGEDYWEGDRIWEYTSLSNFSYGGDALYGVRNYNYSNYNTNFSVSKNYICCWNLDGTIRWETEMPLSQNDDEWIWIQTMSASADGTLTVILSSDIQYVVTVSPQGQMSERKAVSGDIQNALGSYRLIEPTGNGGFFIIYYDNNDWTKEYAVEYDPATNTMSDPVQIPSSILYAYNGMMKTGNQSDLIYSTNTGLYSYNLGDKEGKKIMDYVNSDLYITALRNVIELDDTHFVGMFYENYNQNTMKAGLFTYIPPKDIPDKKVMTLAGMWIDSDLKQRIIEFNRNSQEYRITIKDYSEYNSYEDYEAGRTKLNNDMITGDIPDILVAGSNMPVENYIAKGWLTDINSLIKKDAELSKEEFLQNVFDAYSVNGKLYYVIPSFSVSTMVAKSSIVGDRTSWTMSDMMELQKSLPEGTSMMESMTRDNFLYYIMMYCGNDFIDVETGKCSFNSQAFIDLIEFAKSLPEEIVYDDDFWMHYDSQYREDRTILASTYIGSISGFNRTLNGTFGEDISYIGFPTASGNGAYVSYDTAYCISSKSKNQDGAWEFLRYYLTDEYQESDKIYTFPVQKDVFEAKAQEALNRPYWIDQDGNKQEYDDYFYMSGEAIILNPMTQAQIDKLVNYIYTIDNAYFYNIDIVNIIQEEIGAYFSDQKSASEVVDVIQSRAQVYVDENR